MTDLADTADILIIGAGPSGLALATALRNAGLPALVLDEQLEGANTSRAAVVHARTLEVLEPLGVVPELLAEGLKVPTFRLRDRDATLLTVEFGDLPTAYPFTLMCPQNRTEAILLARLRTLGGTVVRPVELLGIRPAPTEVEADVLSDGRQRTIKARWLVGCDGAHSRVREQAGIAFEGGAYHEDFVLADVHMDWPLARDEVSLFFSPAGLVVVAPLPEGRFRIVATTTEAPEQPPTEYMQAILDARGPTQGVTLIHDIVWSSRFRLQHRIASTVRKGRVLLCGDAAHVHSPAGGQGMNTGIQDAVSLAAPLIEALQTGEESGLDAWAERRHHIAKGVVSITDKMTRAATLEAASARHVRNATLSFVGHLPGVPKMIAHRLAELDSR